MAVLNSADLPVLQRLNADHRLHQRFRQCEADFEPHRRINRAAENRTGARAAPVGVLRGFHAGGKRPSMGFFSPARTRVRIRSAPRLVTSGFYLATGALGRSSWRSPFFSALTRKFLVFSRGKFGFLGNSEIKNEVDGSVSVMDTWCSAVEFPVLP